MTLSTRRLAAVLAAIRRDLPGVRRVSSYCLPRNLRKKSAAELAELAELGLSLVYVGAESGDDEVLARVNKGETFATTREALEKLQEAGIKRSVMILNGLGGEALSRQHALNSAALINAAQPEFLATLVVSFPQGEARLRGILAYPELLRRLAQFQLLAARRAKSTASGERRSKARGQSVEFPDHRNYVAGDDFRHLDWNLFGRLDKLFLKLYEEERELPVHIFLDATESMTFGVPPKFDFARQVAAAAGYVALCGFDRVTVHVFPDLDPNAAGPDPAALSAEMAARGALRAVRGRKSSMQYFQNLSQLSARGPVDLNEALRRGAMAARRSGVAVVLSDFLDAAGYESGLDALIGRGFHVNAVQILAPDKLNPSVDLPPGFKTLKASSKTLFLLLERLITQFEIITSTALSATGKFSISPSLNSTFL